VGGTGTTGTGLDRGDVQNLQALRENRGRTDLNVGDLPFHHDLW
jgi:hypothetical protein